MFTRINPVYDEGPGLFEKAGVKACAEDSELLAETERLRTSIDVPASSI